MGKKAIETGAERTDSSVAEMVYERVLSSILQGRLSPGDVISEVQLAQELGVSRTPVHTAIRGLVKDGLITQRPNYRPVIASFSSVDVAETFEMRVLLEGHAAMLAARRMDRPTLERLRTAARSIGSALGATTVLDQWRRFDDDFHHSIAQASGFRRLAADINRYRMIHSALNRLCLAAEQVPQALAEHFLILDELEARRAEQARDAMVSHLREWQSHYVSAFTRREWRDDQSV